jgi:DNA polymerase III gamma/tau subunit
LKEREICMPLHTKYQVRNLEDIIGNDDIVKSLMSVLDREEDVPHTYLFTGPSGAGKSTLAEIVKDELGCHKNDFFLYNASNSRGIDTIREIQENCVYAPSGGKIKFYLLEEAHQLTPQAQEAILELLIKPPRHVYFGLCTTEPEKLKKTLKRRCHHYTVSPLIRGQLIKLLTRVLKEEGIDDYPKNIITKIVSASDGSAGIALNLLDTIIDIEDEKEALTVIENTTISETAVNEVAQSILGGESWKMFSEKVKGLKGDAESLRRAFANYFGKVMIGSPTPEKASLMMEVLEPFMDNTTTMYSGKAGLDYCLTFAWNATRGG